MPCFSSNCVTTSFGPLVPSSYEYILSFIVFIVSITRHAYSISSKRTEIDCSPRIISSRITSYESGVTAPYRQLWQNSIATGITSSDAPGFFTFNVNEKTASGDTSILSQLDGIGQLRVSKQSTCLNLM